MTQFNAMKKYVLIVIGSLLIGMQSKAIGVMHFHLKYNPVNDNFEVYFATVNPVSYPVAPSLGSAGATIAFDPVFNVNNIVMGATLNGNAFTPVDKTVGGFGGPNVNLKKFVEFESTGANYPTPIAAGTEYLLFTFTFGAGANCSGNLRMYANGVDPIDPTSAGGGQDFTSYLYINGTESDDNNTNQTFNNCAALTVVPVRFLTFTAVRSGNDGMLNWQVGNEDANTDHYDVERSVNRVDFSSIKSVAALNNGRTTNSYPLRDPNIVALKASVIYYRIKQYDRDGRFIYSEIQTLRMKDNASAVFIYPNPARSFINVEADMVQAAQVSIRISDGAGKEVNHTEFKGNNGLNIQRIDVTNLAAGRYVMTILMGSETQSIPFVKSN